MNVFKKTVSIITLFAVVAGIIVGLLIFGGQKKSNRVVVTIFPIYEIAREIMGNDEEITLLQKNGVDLHNYNPTANDIVTISKCELFIFVGGSSDSWVADIIRSANNVNLKTLELISKVPTLEESTENIVQPNPVHENDGSDGEHDHNHADEHIWMSLKNMMIMTEEVLQSLLLVYPERSVILRENADNYIAKLEGLHSLFESEVKGKAKSLLIADRFPFRYLTYDYGIGYHAAFSGCSSETEASTATITQLIETVNTSSLNYIIVLETSKIDLAETIISGCDHPNEMEILMLHSCQSVEPKNLGKLTYLDIMEHNLANLKKALS